MPIKLLVMDNINMLPEFNNIVEGLSTLLTGYFLASSMYPCMTEKRYDYFDNVDNEPKKNVYSQFHFTKLWESFGTSLCSQAQSQYHNVGAEYLVAKNI